MTGADRTIARWVAEHRVEWLDLLFVLLSWLGSHALVWLALAVAVAVLARRALVVAAVAIGAAGTNMIVFALKRLTDVERPAVREPGIDALVRIPTDPSFPSGHAATSFCAAALLVAFAPRFAVPFYALAAAIAVSRVYVGVHYPLDVVAGAILGLGLGLGLRRVLLAARPDSFRPGPRVRSNSGMEAGARAGTSSVPPR